MEKTIIEKASGKKISDLIGDEDTTICVKVDNRLRETNYVITDDERHEIVKLDLKDSEAVKVYEASLRYLIGMAVERAFPDMRVKISYGISKSMMLSFFSIKDAKPILATSKIRDRLESELNSLIAENLPIIKKTITKDDALKIYAQHGYKDRLEALQYRPETTVHLYECDGYLDYPYSYMVTRTGKLSHFRLLVMTPGLILSYPRAEDDGKILPLETDSSFAKALKKTRVQSARAGLTTIAAINDVLNQFGPTVLVGMCEDYCSEQYLRLAELYQSRAKTCRLILISGPSSSSKTTFAKRLRTLLMSYGLRPIRISMDDYYIDRNKMKKGPDGKYDLEGIGALDLDHFHEDMLSLAKGKQTSIPIFNFALQRKSGERTIQPDGTSPIIVEGIHALNPQITASLDRDLWMGVYISPQVQVSIDDHNPMSLTDIRLIRRMVRDHKFRNTSAEKTIETWSEVRRGEFANIYPFQDNADFVFNSYLGYEMCALKTHAMPLLSLVNSSSASYITANRLMKFLKYFPAIPEEVIPCDSLIREFIGGSSYED